MTRPGRYGSERIHLTNVPCQVADGHWQGQLIQYWRQYLYVIDRIPVHGPARSGIVGTYPLSTLPTPTRSHFRVITVRKISVSWRKKNYN
jgi:hypothetical protein